MSGLAHHLTTEANMSRDSDFFEEQELRELDAKADAEDQAIEREAEVALDAVDAAFRAGVEFAVGYVWRTDYVQNLVAPLEPIRAEFSRQVDWAEVARIRALAGEGGA